MDYVEIGPKERLSLQKCLFLLVVACFVTVPGFAAANLLVNGDFSSGNIGFTTGYVFVQSGQSAVISTYGVRSSSIDFNSGYTSFGDHTTGSGKMMLVDGSGAAGTVAWSETVTVETNKTYVFSGWAASSNSSNPAKLRVTVNGIQVGADLQLGSTGGQWQKFSFAWNSGASQSAQISIVDANLIGLGNDFALDDLSFALSEVLPVTAAIYIAVEIDWTSQADATYQVQYSNTADSGVWIDLGAPMVGTGGAMAVFDSSRANPERIYRIVALP